MKGVFFVYSDETTFEALLLSRAYLYHLFHRAFAAPPTSEFLELLAGGATVDACEEFEGEAPSLARFREFLQGAFAEKPARDPAVQDAADEFNRIMYGFDKGAVPLCESAYAVDGGGYFTAVTLAVRECYRKAGVLPARYPRVPDDHVALELAYCARLADRVLEALRARRMAELREAVAAHGAFLDGHLGCWIGAFGSEIRKGKTQHLYPQAATALQDFVAADQAFCGNALAWLDERALLGEAGGLAGGPDAAATHANATRPSSFAAFERALEALRAQRAECGEFVLVPESSVDTRRAPVSCAPTPGRNSTSSGTSPVPR